MLPSLACNNSDSKGRIHDAFVLENAHGLTHVGVCTVLLATLIFVKSQPVVLHDTLMCLWR